MLNVLLSVIHIISCLFLVLVVLLQQGRGGGLGSALGGGATQQVFGGRGAGNLLTRLTGIFATTFMLTSVSLAYLASAGDIKLKAVATKKHATDLPIPASAAQPPPPSPGATTTPAATDAPPSGSAPRPE